MTNYYSNKSDFSSGSGTGTTSNYYGASYSIDGETQLTNLLTAIDEVAQVVKSEGLSHLYVQTGDASLGKDMPSSTFSTAYDRADSMLTSAKRIHSEVLERLDGKFTKGVDNSLKSLNEVNGSEKPYQSKNLTYQKTNTMYDEMGNAYDYQTTEHYSLADILDHKASPVKAAQEIYQNRLENLRDKLTEANGISAEEVKKYKGMSDEELMSQFYISGQIGNYSSLKHFQWQEDNKEWLEPVEQWLGIGLLAVSIVASVVSWGAASPTVVAAATAVATTTATAGTVYSVVDGGYSAITGNTLVSGTALDTDDRLWAAAEAITAAGTMGVGRVFKAAGAADDTIKVATKAADTVDDATNLAHIGYNTIIHGEDPTLALVSFAGGKVVSGVNKHIEESRAKSNGDSGGGNPAYQEYVERKILEGKSYLSEPDWAQKVATIESNTSTYSNFKASQLEVFKSQATDVESNITIETRNTAGDVQRVQVKAIGFDEAGNIRIQDYTTATGGLSVSRQALIEDLSKYGGTVVGKGKGAFTGGTEIKPGTQIDVVSQKTNDIVIDKHGNSFKVITLKNGENAYLSKSTDFNGNPVPVRSLDYLKADGTINWPPEDGFVLKADGSADKTEVVLRAGEVIDRFGSPHGAFTSPVVDGVILDYDTRGLPYPESYQAYHQYEITTDITMENIQKAYDSLPDSSKIEFDNDLADKDKQLSDLASNYIGTIDTVFGAGGGTQIQFGGSLQFYIDLGFVREILP